MFVAESWQNIKIGHIYEKRTGVPRDKKHDFHFDINRDLTKILMFWDIKTMIFSLSRTVISQKYIFSRR